MTTENKRSSYCHKKSQTMFKIELMMKSHPTFSLTSFPLVKSWLITKTASSMYMTLHIEKTYPAGVISVGF